MHNCEMITTTQLLLFSVGSIQGAVPLEMTWRVIRMVQPERQEGRPPWDAGTINLHGRTISVISVRSLFGLKDNSPHLTDMLIITRAGDRDVALWVDSTSGVQEIPLSSELINQPYIPEKTTGIQRTAEGILVICDLPALIASGGIQTHTPTEGITSPECSDSGGDLDRNSEQDTVRINTVLSERAAKISRPDYGQIETKTAEVLRFRLAYREYAIEMDHIREVILTGEITPVPGTPAFISGICIVRGEIISLVDMRVLLGIPEMGLTDLNRVIVLTDRSLTFGILADHITGIGTIELTRIIHDDTTSSAGAGSYIKGIAEGGLILLNTAALLSDPLMIIDEG